MLKRHPELPTDEIGWSFLNRTSGESVYYDYKGTRIEVKVKTTVTAAVKTIKARMESDQQVQDFLCRSWV